MRHLLLVAALSACSLADFHNAQTFPRSCPWNHVAADAGFATVTLIGGGYLLYTAEPGKDSFGFPKDLDRKVGGAALLVASAAYVVSGAYGYDFSNRCEEHHEQLARDEARLGALMAQREHAWTLTRDAAAAARAGDCAKVRELNTQVLETDVEFYTLVFRADVAIRRCLVH